MWAVVHGKIGISSWTLVVHLVRAVHGEELARPEELLHTAVQGAAEKTAPIAALLRGGRKQVSARAIRGAEHG